MKYRALKQALARIAAEVAGREASAKQAALPVFDLDALRRSNRAAAGEVGRLLGGAPGADAVAAYLDEWPDIMSLLSPLLPRVTAPGVPLPDDDRRWPAAAVWFFRLLPADLRSAAATPAALSGNRAHPWAGEWVEELAALKSRLPPDVSQEVLRRLVAAFASGKCEVETWPIVCVACGLRRPLWPPDGPHDAPCPHCGERDGTVTRGHDIAAYPWREAARKELDAVAIPDGDAVGPAGRSGGR